MTDLGQLLQELFSQGGVNGSSLVNFPVREGRSSVSREQSLCSSDTSTFDRYNNDIHANIKVDGISLSN